MSTSARSENASSDFKTRFVQLINGFCALVRLGEAEAIQQGWGVEVNGVIFFLVYRERIAPELLFVDCDFGEVPKGRETEVYRALLETNCLLYPMRRSVFTISRRTQRVTFSNHYRLGELDAEGLFNIISKLSDQAKAWQGDYFLNPKTSGAERKSTQARLAHLAR